MPETEPRTAMPERPPPSARLPDAPMRIENPPLPEGINAPDRHRPLRDFFVQGTLALGVFALCLLVLSAVAGLLAPRLPFSWEQRAAARFWPQMPASPEEAALNELAARVAHAMGLPADMPIVIHYWPDDCTINAAATLGGHIVVYRGLLRQMESEDELAALLAHEIAHVQHRDVARGVLRGIAAALLLAGVDSVSPVFSGATSLATLSFSREQERQADAAAARATAALYGHTGGALALFSRLQTHMAHGMIDRLELARSHPDFPRRLQTVRTQSRQLGAPETGTLTPLPAPLRALREAENNCPAGEQ